LRCGFNLRSLKKRSSRAMTSSTLTSFQHEADDEEFSHLHAIAGNKYRIVLWINYPYGVVYSRFL
jgi:mRNA-degrading endonuclease HigB of HigAB toxin-antitoxin module